LSGVRWMVDSVSNNTCMISGVKVILAGALR
jgi:hypothetical protein